MSKSIHDPFSGEEFEPVIEKPAKCNATAKYLLLIGAAIISIIPSALALVGFLAFRFRLLWWWELRWAWGLHWLDSASVLLMAVFPCCFALVYRKNSRCLPILGWGVLIFAVIHTLRLFAPVISYSMPFTLQFVMFGIAAVASTLVYGALWFCIALLCLRLQKVIAYRCFLYAALWTTSGIYHASVSFFRFLYSPIIVDAFAIFVPVYCILTLCSFVKAHCQTLKHLKQT